MANNTEWLDKVLDDFMYNATPVNLNYLKGKKEAKLAITAKINEIEKQAYNKGYIDGGIYGITQLTENLTERG